MKISKYNSLNHAKFILKYHLIFSTKYRRRLLFPIINDLKTSFQRAETLSNKKWKIEIVEIDKNKADHIHFLVSAVPQISPFEIVHSLKQISTYDIWHSKWFNYLRKYYWKQHHLWTRGYFCSTIGDVSTKIIMDYIEKQG